MKTLLAGTTVIVCLLATACSDGSRSRACQIESVLPEPAAGAAPRDRLALGNWMLILPVDESGGRSGPADMVFPAELEGGYSSEWFFASDDGGVAFWAPVNGARTLNSATARSELRYLRQPDDPRVNWSIGDTASLRASLSVSQVPTADGRVVVGKIVGFRNDDEEYPTLVRLILRLHDNTCRASLFALIAEAPLPNAPSQELTLVDDAITLNQRFGYTIAMDKGVLTLRSGAREQVVQIDPRWADTPVYFMAGSALTVSGTDSADGGSVTFHELVVSE